MKHTLLTTALLAILCFPCMSQTSRPAQNLTSYFNRQGYRYLQAAHTTCDVAKVGVFFPASVTDSGDFVVGLTYKDIAGQRFTCYYTISYVNGSLTNLRWECHSPDIQCFKFCDGVLDRLMKAYQRDHKPGNTLDQLQQRIAGIFNKTAGNLTCSNYVLGFLMIDYADQKQ